MALPVFTWPEMRKSPKGLRIRHNDTGECATFVRPARNRNNGAVVVWDRAIEAGVATDRAGVFFVGAARDATPIRIKAWDLIGFDGRASDVDESLHHLIGPGVCNIRIRGGRAQYEAVLYNDVNDAKNVKLARLEAGPDGIREVSRYVDPDTELELIEVSR